MNKLQEAIERHQKRVASIQELERALSYERQAHYTLTKEDFGIAEGEQINVMTIIECVSKISELNRRPPCKSVV